MITITYWLLIAVGVFGLLLGVIIGLFIGALLSRRILNKSGMTLDQQNRVVSISEQ